MYVFCVVFKFTWRIRVLLYSSTAVLLLYQDTYAVQFLGVFVAFSGRDTSSHLCVSPERRGEREGGGPCACSCFLSGVGCAFSSLALLLVARWPCCVSTSTGVYLLTYCCCIPQVNRCTRIGMIYLWYEVLLQQHTSTPVQQYTKHLCTYEYLYTASPCKLISRITTAAPVLVYTSTYEVL